MEAATAGSSKADATRSGIGIDGPCVREAEAESRLTVYVINSLAYAILGAGTFLSCYSGARLSSYFNFSLHLIPHQLRNAALSIGLPVFFNDIQNKENTPREALRLVVLFAITDIFFRNVGLGVNYGLLVGTTLKLLVVASVFTASLFISYQLFQAVKKRESL